MLLQGKETPYSVGDGVCLEEDLLFCCFSKNQSKQKTTTFHFNPFSIFLFFDCKLVNVKLLSNHKDDS